MFFEIRSFNLISKNFNLIYNNNELKLLINNFKLIEKRKKKCFFESWNFDHFCVISKLLFIKNSLNLNVFQN